MSNASLGEYDCPADNRTFQDTEAIPFENTGIIVRTHEKTPRFGHSSNITSVIYDGSKEEARDYFVGILSASIAMFIFFLVWMSFLLICKCVGYKLVGFFSGSSVKIPPPPKPSSDEKDGIIKQEEGSSDEKDGIIKQEGAEGGSAPAEPPAGSVGLEEVGGRNDGSGVQDLGGQEETEAVKTELITSSSDYEQELEIWKKSVKVRERRQRRIRIVVLFCGLVIVVLCVLMIVYGINSLTKSLLSGRAGLRKAEDLAYTGVEIIDRFVVSQNKTFDAARILDDEASCAPVVDAICQTFEQGEENCIPKDDIQTFLQGIEDTVTTELTEMRDDLLEVTEILNDLNGKVGQFEWAFWVAAGAAILLALLTILIMSGVILAWQNKLHGNCIQKFASCIRGWLVVPFFILLVIIGWVLSMVFVIGSTAAADMCYNSPDENVVIILDKLKYKFSSVVFQLLVYYVSGCPADSFPADFQETVELVVTMLAKLQTLSEQLVSSADDISQQCSSGSLAIAAALTVLQDQVCAINTVIHDLADFFTCRNWNSLYAIVMYNAVCYKATDGFSWIATTQFFIVLFSMIMLTLRVGFYEMEDEEEYKRQRRCLLNSCCCCSRCGRGGREEVVGENGNIHEQGVGTLDQHQLPPPPEEAVAS